MDLTRNMVLPGSDIRAVRHSVEGREELEPAEVFTYLVGAGYGPEAGTVIDEARRFPGTCAYTKDRHRYAVWIMPGGHWRAGDCAESEDRIRSLGAGRRSWGSW